ncbi:MAG: hypothetical protein RL375_4857 [Pseudomonadota bacterium]
MPLLSPATAISSPRQALEAAAELREARSELVRAPHVRLSQLRKLDEQLAQQCELLASTGEAALRRRASELTRPSDVFIQAVLALQLHKPAAFDELIERAQHQPRVEQALASALGWVPAAALQGRLREMLAGPLPVARRVALSACVMHRVDPGAVLLPCLLDSDPGVRAAAARTAACVGRVDTMDMLLEALALIDSAAQGQAPDDEPGDDGPDSEFPSTEVLRYDDEVSGGSGPVSTGPREDWPDLPEPSDPIDPAEVLRTDARGWSAWAAVLLGDRGAGLATLGELALSDKPFAAHALPLYMRACDVNDAHDVLRTLTRRSGATARRRLIQGCGAVGDPLYLPWLMDMMTEDAWARVAGESFALITGADLIALDLVRHRPEGITTRPGEYLAEADPGRIDDVHLPWPDRHSVSAWWNAQQVHFPVGRRHFMGGPPSVDRAIDVLGNGLQRQRAAAAQWLALLRPGKRLFPVRAPVRRQKRWLLELGAPG